uniref:Uncharacterized protein n=1 Tax=Rhizophagus irregularis (strain DAOM 181602 / DAOM 197198 / MUCL 43194) TaxID=747089 RepID=U9TU12_RHIID
MEFVPYDQFKKKLNSLLKKDLAKFKKQLGLTVRLNELSEETYNILNNNMF